MLKHYEGEHCMNWRRTEGHDKTVSECFPCLSPEINEGREIIKNGFQAAWITKAVKNAINDIFTDLNPY